MEACDVAPAQKSESEPSGEDSLAGAMCLSGASDEASEAKADERPGGREERRLIVRRM